MKMLEQMLGKLFAPKSKPIRRYKRKEFQVYRDSGPYVHDPAYQGYDRKEADRVAVAVGGYVIEVKI